MTALGALIFETTLSMISPEFFKFDFSTLSFALIAFVLVEEFLKLAVIWKISQNIISKTEIFLNSLLLGMGFGITEIILNIFSQTEFYFSLYLNLALIHIITCIFFGYLFSRKYNFAKIIFVFLLANLTHFLYNFSILKDFKPIFASGILLLIAIFCIGFYFSCQVEKTKL